MGGVEVSGGRRGGKSRRLYESRVGDRYHCGFGRELD